MKYLLSLLVMAAVILIFQESSYCQARYSYIDEDGVQNFTNIAPVRPVYDLKISGTPEPATPPQTQTNSKSQSYDPLIEKYAAEQRLDPSLIRSIIAQESGFNAKAVSPKGARGLMQLMPATAERLGVKNSFDPEQNIQGGVKHFRFLMDNFNNNLELSLAAYNAGENLVQRLGRVPAIRETQDYVQSVTQRYGKKDVSLQVQEAPGHPPTFRFVDESGVLHLTNIPPQNTEFRDQESGVRTQN
jgi:soluble lytic murein transglycosylase-like protein